MKDDITPELLAALAFGAFGALVVLFVYGNLKDWIGWMLP